MGKSTLEEYDPMTDTWKEVASMPTARYWPSSSVVDGKIYVVGGSPGGGALLPTMEEYTPEGWQPKAVSPRGKLATTWGEEKTRK
jgi:hypothetical protein